MKRSRLPKFNEVRVLGFGKARAIRTLYAGRATVNEIAEFLHVDPHYVSEAIRWKAGARPLCLRRLAA